MSKEHSNSSKKVGVKNQIYCKRIIQFQMLHMIIVAKEPKLLTNPHSSLENLKLFLFEQYLSKLRACLSIGARVSVCFHVPKKFLIHLKGKVSLRVLTLYELILFCHPRAAKKYRRSSYFLLSIKLKEFDFFLFT